MRTAVNDQVESMLVEYRSLTERLRGLGERVAATEVTEKSSDGKVSVTVNHRGELIGLELAGLALAAGGCGEQLKPLAEAILRTAAGAAEAARARTRNLVESCLPPNIRGLSAALTGVDLSDLFQDPPGRAGPRLDGDRRCRSQ